MGQKWQFCYRIYSPLPIKSYTFFHYVATWPFGIFLKTHNEILVTYDFDFSLFRGPPLSTISSLNVERLLNIQPYKFRGLPVCLRIQFVMLCKLFWDTTLCSLVQTYYQICAEKWTVEQKTLFEIHRKIFFEVSGFILFKGDLSGRPRAHKN